MDEEDDPITIDHLLGVNCILNGSIKVGLRRPRKKGSRIELYTEGADRHYLLVSAVLDMSADGGFVIELSNRKGEVISERVNIIAESLYQPKPIKRATA